MEECRKNYADGSYSDALFSAFKCVDIKVREASGLKDLEGRKLMSEAFRIAAGKSKYNSISNIKV